MYEHLAYLKLKNVKDYLSHLYESIKTGRPMNMSWAQRWIWELRHGGHKQTVRDYIDGGCYCALGLLMLVDGELESEFAPSRRIDDYLFRDVVRWNDRDRFNFRQIADRLERSKLFSI